MALVCVDVFTMSSPDNNAVCAGGTMQHNSAANQNAKKPVIFYGHCTVWKNFSRTDCVIGVY